MSDEVVEPTKFRGLKKEHAGKWVVADSKTGKILLAADSLAESLKKTDSVKRRRVFKALGQFYAGAAL